MASRDGNVRRGWRPLMILCVALLLVPLSTIAASAAQGPWWEVVPEPENPSPLYDSILYSEIAPRLREIEVQSNRVKIDVIGQSAGGRNLFLATVSAPEALGRLGQYQAIRQTMLRNPEKAQALIEQLGDFKVPVFINGSIHGGEYPGTDAAIRLIETLAYKDTEEVRAVLDNVILLVNVVQNPDGRVMGTRRNAAGFDLNRDFITQSQPETRATVRVLTEWNPMVVLDLHGFVNPMLIEPCTPPHNPNYEYDLYIRWALAEAEAMEAELMAQTGFSAQIPFRDGYYGEPEGWDDWPPIFAPMYAMYHGAYGHTLETPYRDARGVEAHYHAVWGALKFIAENRVGMIHDQIEIFRRGFLDLPQVRIPQEILDQTYEQYNEMTVIDFPAAYVIPRDAPWQQSPYEAARLVGFLLQNDVEVAQANETFVLEGTEYPKGSYVVWMDQPKRGLANTILWAGWDISYDPGLTMYDISGWSHPLLWGVSRAVMEEGVEVKTHLVNRADAVQGSVVGRRAGAYAYLPTSNAAIRATNDLLTRGRTVYWMEVPFTDSGQSFGGGTFILPGGNGAKSLANELASQYGLDVVGLLAVPEGATLLHKPRIAVNADEGVRFALKALGFEYDWVPVDELTSGAMMAYDVFVNDWWWWSDFDADEQAAWLAFFAAGGDYIGIGRNGVMLADQAELLDFEWDDGGGRDNGILQLDYVGEDPIVGQFPEDGFGFVYRPVWFPWHGPEVRVAASIDAGDFFVSGYWPGWNTSGAAGQPILLHGAKGSSEVTLMGINPTFRAHPEHTFRVLANAIYNGLD